MPRGEFEGDEAGRCGGCGSRNLLTLPVASDRGLGLCRSCGRMQEVETRAWPESVMCGNCAFRVGSPERADPYRWAEIEGTLARGQSFHCHKGLAYHPDSGEFDPPDSATGRVTVCAGWLAAYFARLRRAEHA